MPKTQEELNALKEKELETESKKPRELTEEEIAQVSGGGLPVFIKSGIELLGDEIDFGEHGNVVVLH